MNVHAPTEPSDLRAAGRKLPEQPCAVSEPVGAVARLQLGRALALSGERAKAKAAYRDFLARCKDAGCAEANYPPFSDIPIQTQDSAADFAHRRNSVLPPSG